MVTADVARRGDVWWVDFGLPIESEPGYRRPALIVSSDRFNRSRIATVIVSAITSNVDLAAAPGNVALADGDGGLDRDSVVNVSQTLVIDRNRLDHHAGRLDGDRMSLVDRGLRLVLDL